MTDMSLDMSDILPNSHKKENTFKVPSLPVKRPHHGSIREASASSSIAHTVSRSALFAPRKPLQNANPAQRNRQQPGMLSMESFMLDVLRSDLKIEQASANQKRVHQKWEYAILFSENGLESQGDRSVRRVLEGLEWVDKNMFPRSKQQKMMHHAMLMLSFEQYFGEDISNHIVRILKKYKMSELRTEGLFGAPRRFGKSICGSCYSAVEVVVLTGVKGNPKGHDVLVYSNNQRASSLFLMHTYRIIRALSAEPKFGGSVTHLNRKEKLIFMTAEGFQNEISAYPANEEKLRGTGSSAYTSTVIGEEVGFMPVDIVMKILAPILTRKRTKFIGITTMNTKDPFLKPLMEAKYPDGRKVMITLDFDLVCDECKRKGRALECKCMASDIPHWQSAKRHDKLSILMESHKATLLTELKNVPIDERMSAAFSRDHVEWLRTDDAVLRRRDIFADHVFTTVDPAAGGSTSNFAIISVIFREQMMIIVGADSCQTKHPSFQADRLVNHINAVRALPGLRSAKIVFCPESNLGMEGIRIAEDLARKRLPHVYALREDKGEIGVKSSEMLKKEMAIKFERLLCSRKLVFHPLMVCISNQPSEEMTPNKMRKMLIDQLTQYMKEVRYDTKDPTKPPKELFSGKAAGPDDHCIALQIAYKSIDFWYANYTTYSKMDPLWEETPILSGRVY